MIEVTPSDEEGTLAAVRFDQIHVLLSCSQWMWTTQLTEWALPLVTGKVWKMKPRKNKNKKKPSKNVS